MQTTNPATATQTATLTRAGYFVFALHNFTGAGECRGAARNILDNLGYTHLEAATGRRY